MPLIPFEVEKQYSRNTVVLKISGPLCTETRLELDPYIEEIESTPNIQEVILNLDRLTHLDSRGLATLLTLHRSFTERDISFRLVNVSDDILRLFQVSNLVNLFEIGPPPQDQIALVHERREALWQAHAFTTQLIGALGEAVLGIDAEGRFLFANPVAEKLLDWDEVDLLGRSLTESLNPRDLNGKGIDLSVTSPLPEPSSAVKGGSGKLRGMVGGETESGIDQLGPITRLEVTLNKRGGEALEVEWVATTIFHAGKRIGRVIGLRDLTQKKHAQDELKRLAVAVDQAAEMIVITDPQGFIQYVNPAFEKMTGYTRAEVFGKKTNILRSEFHEAQFFKDLWSTISSGQVWSGRFTNRRKDNRLYQEEATISPVHDSNGNIINYVAVKRDITQEVLLEQQLRESQKFEAIAQLAGGIAHDFNNLLTSVIGNIQLAKSKPGGDIQSYLVKAEQACMRGAALVQQLLLYSRKTTAPKNLVNLNTIVREVLALARETIDRRIEFVVHLNPELPQCRIDSGQFHQVLLNLVVNARDAIESGGGTPPHQITLCTDVVAAPPRSIHGEGQACGETPAMLTVLQNEVPPSRFLILSVTDTGMGMDAKTKDHLFEPFFTTKEVGKGTGLGLATAYGIVKSHGGWLEVESSPGQGSIFTVILPLEEADEEGVPQEEGVAPTAKLVGGSETILVVDDELSICDVAKDILESYGYRIFVANDGEEALALYERHLREGGPETDLPKLDLVIVDLSMPKMSGNELMEYLRRLSPHQRIIVSTGYLADELISKLNAPVVHKPYRPDDLVRAVREVLDR